MRKAGDRTVTTRRFQHAISHGKSYPAPTFLEMPSPPWQQRPLLFCFLFEFFYIYFGFNRNIDTACTLLIRSRLPRHSFHPDDFSQSMSESIDSIVTKMSYTVNSLSHLTDFGSSAVTISDSFSTTSPVTKTDLHYTREMLIKSESSLLNTSSHKIATKLKKRSVSLNSTTKATTSSHLALSSITSANDSISPLYASLYDNFFIPNNDIATATPLNIPRMNVFGLFSDGDTIILKYSTDTVMFRCIDCFNENTYNGGYTGKGSRIALASTQKYDPGRLSQFAVEVVSVDNSTRRAVIRLRTDDSTYVRGVINVPDYYSKAVIADSVSSTLAGTLWTIIPNSDGFFKMMDEISE